MYIHVVAAFSHRPQTFCARDRALPYRDAGAGLPSGATCGDAWQLEWSGNMDDWFCWRDPDAVAVQVHLLAHTTPVDVTPLRNDLADRCAVLVALQDALVPVEQQRSVAARLGTDHVLELDCGHMIGREEVRRVLLLLLLLLLPTFRITQDYQRFVCFLLDHLAHASGTKASL